MLNAHTLCFWWTTETGNVILKTEQATTVYAPWDRWAPHDNHWCYIKGAVKAMSNPRC